MKMYVTLCVGLLCLGTLLPVAADVNREALLKAADTEVSGEYTRQRFLAVQKKPFDSADNRKKALIIGDSHAQDFFNGVLENGYLANYQLSTRYIPTRCQMFLDEAAAANIEPKDAALCAESDNLTQAATQIAEADVVILVARWQEWAAKLLPETIKSMNLRADQSLVVVGAKDFGKVSIRNYLKLSDDELRAFSNKVDPKPLATNQLLRDSLGTAVFVDQQRLICGEGASCRLFTDELELISYDGGHLTPAGAKYVGKRLFTDSLFQRFQ
ncbi:SGNH hydrolase domain-containing protein [Thiothrix fructosivorans]|jgi:hypothetical protein|uniref:SGNH domain-containing protein n=1 Tax=Thiothrix fructosivorans TaxID=111770 RepID=A0A8B0SKJ7_9GAMM|nr:SGNH hydrolase domain-containing protein [Thiothrix fructosivorans]MBO0613920.1 hypothetical protein [Thiothrix fructosivorans]QTX10287.1 hypothetical protein J1836_017125 [Thiothrix fructosivorans]